MLYSSTSLLQADFLAAHYNDTELHARNPSRYSLGLAALSPAPPALASLYHDFLSRLQAVVPSTTLRDHFFLYPSASLHCTCATLHGYSRSPPRSPAKLRAIWARAASIAASVTPPFRLRVERLSLHNSAGVLTLSDEDGGLAALRARLLAEVHRAPELAQEIHEAGSSLEYFRAPNIAHMTFMRVRKGLPRGDRLHQVQQQFDEAAQTIADVSMELLVEHVTLRESTSFHALDGNAVQLIPLLAKNPAPVAT